MPAPRASAVLQGVNRNLREMEKRQSGVSRSALAEAARELAREMGDPDNSATSKALAARALMELLESLDSSLPPAEKEADSIDQVAAARERRRSGAA